MHRRLRLTGATGGVHQQRWIFGCGRSLAARAREALRHAAEMLSMSAGITCTVAPDCRPSPLRLMSRTRPRRKPLWRHNDPACRTVGIRRREHSAAPTRTRRTSLPRNNCAVNRPLSIKKATLSPGSNPACRSWVERKLACSCNPRNVNTRPVSGLMRKGASGCVRAIRSISSRIGHTSLPVPAVVMSQQVIDNSNAGSKLGFHPVCKAL